MLIDINLCCYYLKSRKQEQKYVMIFFFSNIKEIKTKLKKKKRLRKI